MMKFSAFVSLIVIVAGEMCTFFYFFVFLFLVFVFIAFQKVHMLTNSGYCPRLVVAAVGSLLLATAPT